MGNQFLTILISVLAVSAAVVGVIFIIVPLFKGIGWATGRLFRAIGAVIAHVFRFFAGMIGDVIRAIGSLLTTLLFIPMVLGNVVIGRWSASSHYGRALQDEVKSFGHCVYRVVIGHPARFLLLHGLTEGFEKRLPQAMAQAPGADRPSHRTGQFDGYKIVGSLQGGGSGGRLYVAEPDARKAAAFARAGRTPTQVVIKSFSLSDGSSLPQIIRESRALEAAKKLGLILDHELTDSRFFYVMEFIPGDSLSVVTRRLHAESPADGLSPKALGSAMSHIADLLTELTRYHRGGLWHKDVKPDNIIVNAGRAHLVDLGLITPLRSAMTLTTHGTEYFRDPEMVRMALRGAKVNEVDGVKFDLYGVGAVLYSIIENNFPAHGGLSQLTRKCPEALRWVVRRAMTDLSNRYASAEQMLADLRVVMESTDPYALKPIDLPSVAGGAASPAPIPEPEETPWAAAAAAAAAAQPKVYSVPLGKEHDLFVSVNAGVGDPNASSRTTPPPGGRARPRIRVTDWISGKYVAGEGADAFVGPNAPRNAAEFAAAAVTSAMNAADAAIQHAQAAMGRAPGSPVPPRAGRRGGVRAAGSAADQLARARERVHRAQSRVSRRLGTRAPKFNNNPNSGVIFSVLVLFVAIGGFVSWVNSGNGRSSETRVSAGDADTFSITSDGKRYTLRVPTDDGKERTGVEKLNELGENFSQFVDQVRDAGNQIVDSVRSKSRKGRTGVSASLPPTPPELPPAPETGADHSTSVVSIKTPSEEAAFETPDPQNPAHPLYPAPEDPKADILILNDLPMDVSQTETARINAMVERLHKSGFAARGLGSEPADTDLIAKGKTIIRLGTPDDQEAVARVQKWLDSGDAGVDAVLWLGQGKKRGEVIRRLLVATSAKNFKIRSALIAN